MKMFPTEVAFELNGQKEQHSGFCTGLLQNIVRESQLEPSLDAGLRASPPVPITHPLAPDLGDRPRPAAPSAARDMEEGRTKASRKPPSLSL